jgi:hypothetical protein
MLTEELRQENGVTTNAEIDTPNWTLFRLTRHCLTQSDIVQVAVSGKYKNNELPWIRSKLCRYDLGYERN